MAEGEKRQALLLEAKAETIERKKAEAKEKEAYQRSVLEQ